MADPGASGLQSAFNVIVGLIIALGGFVLKSLRDDHSTLREKHDNLVDNLPSIYARRDDVREAMTEVKAALIRIEGKLDNRTPRQHSQ